MKKRMRKLLACGSGLLSVTALVAIPLSINWNGVLNSSTTSVIDKNTNSANQEINLDSSNDSFNGFVNNENLDQPQENLGTNDSIDNTITTTPDLETNNSTTNDSNKNDVIDQPTNEESETITTTPENVAVFKYAGLKIDDVEMLREYTSTKVIIKGSGLGSVDQDDIYLVKANGETLEITSKTLIKNKYETENWMGTKPPIRIISRDENQLIIIAEGINLDFGRYVVGIDNSYSFIAKRTSNIALASLESRSDLQIGYYYYDDIRDNKNIKYKWTRCHWYTDYQGKTQLEVTLNALNGSDLRKMNIYDLFFYKIVEYSEYTFQVIAVPDGSYIYAPVWDPYIKVELLDKNGFEEWKKQQGQALDDPYAYYLYLQSKYNLRIVSKTKDEFKFAFTDLPRSGFRGYLISNAISNGQFWSQNYGADLFNKYNFVECQKIRMNY